VKREPAQGAAYLCCPRPHTSAPKVSCTSAVRGEASLGGWCFSHVANAAEARARTHGEDELMRVSVRAADHVCDASGPDGDQDVCGHPERSV
jgi:DUF1680 family protein